MSELSQKEKTGSRHIKSVLHVIADISLQLSDKKKIIHPEYVQSSQPGFGPHDEEACAPLVRSKVSNFYRCRTPIDIEAIFIGDWRCHQFINVKSIKTSNAKIVVLGPRWWEIDQSPMAH